MKAKSFVVVIAVVFAAIPLFAATADYLLKIEGIPGESKAAGHADWIDIESFSWGTARNTAQNCSVHDITITKHIDKASPQLAQAALTGQTFPSVTVEVNGERHMLQNVQIKSVQNTANGGQAINMSFAKCLTHESGPSALPIKKATDIAIKQNAAAGIIIKMDSNGTIAVGRGAGEAIALQDLHFNTPTQAVMTVRKAGQTNGILIGLNRAAATGQHIPEVKITCRKAGGGQQEYYVVTMSDVLVSSYQSGGGGGAGFDQVTLNFAKLDGPMAPFRDVLIK